jgi:hypothetical protein
MASKVDSPWDTTVQAIMTTMFLLQNEDHIAATIREALEQAYSKGYNKAMHTYRNAPPEPGN